MNKDRYDDNSLVNFREIIYSKMKKSYADLEAVKKSLQGKDHPGVGSSQEAFEDNTGNVEKDRLIALAERQRKFINQLDWALFRIREGTYGVCLGTGKLISAARLEQVPHTMYSIEYKMQEGYA